MSNYKQLCAELVEAWDSTADGEYEDFGRAASYLVDRARAALAEPEPEPEEVKKWLLTNCVFSGMPPEPYQAWNEWAEAVVSAKVIQGIYIKALNSPPEGPPTDEKLLAALKEAIIAFPPNHPDAQGLSCVEYETQLELRKARAVLARWGNHVLQPIPVSERMPKPGDCNDEGEVWAWRTYISADDEDEDAEFWMTIPAKWLPEFPRCWSHWLPAHALPLPTHE